MSAEAHPSAVVPRHVYNTALRAAIFDATQGTPVITIAELRRLLPQHFDLPMPGGPALAKILQTIGWRKVTTASGPAFACPKPTAAIGTLN